MNKLPIMIILLLIIITGATYIYLQTNQNANPADILEAIRTEPNPEETDTPEGGEEPSLPPVLASSSSNSASASGGGGGGGGSGGGSSETTSSSQDCSDQQITYSLKQFQKTEVCNTTPQNPCTDKTITCSIVVTNLNDLITGQFIIRFNFFQTSDPTTIIDSLTDSHSISPIQSQTFSTSLDIQGSQADNEFNCDIDTEEIPTREICV